MTTQAEAALILANEVRLARAEIKHAVKATRTLRASLLVLADALDGDVPPCLRSARLGDVLRWPFKSLPSTRARLLAACGASPERRLGELTYRQRVALVTAMRGGET